MIVASSRWWKISHTAVLSLLPLMAASSHAMAGGRFDQIVSAKVLRVCIWPDYYAITFRNPRTGKLEGIDIDLSREFAKDLAVSVKHIDSSFATFMDDLQADHCDVAMFAIGDTRERRSRVEISEPHLRSGIYAITTQSNQMIKSWSDLDKPGHVIAVQQGTVMEPYMRQTLRHATLNICSGSKTREQEVLAGRADAFMTDYPYAKRMRFQHDWARIVEPPTPLAQTNYGFAVAKGDRDWLNHVNAFVARIKADGRLARAAATHKLSEIIVRD